MEVELPTLHSSLTKENCMPVKTKAVEAGRTAESTSGSLKTSRTKAAVPSVEAVFGRGGAPARITESRPATTKTPRRANQNKTPGLALRATKQGRLVGECPRRVNETGTAHTCQQLRELQRRKVAALKARIAIDNQLTALVAIELGYSAGLEEKARKVLWTKSKALIKAIDDGKSSGTVGAGVVSVIRATLLSSDGFQTYLSAIEKEMVKLVKTLPVAKWCDEVRGFGLLSLAAIVGECGNIGEFRGPASLWKRLGLAPIQSRGVTQMPSTWRSKGGLSAEEWTEAGYSPRRRSIMFVIGECLVKQNKGEFRARYDEAKKAGKKKHKDWTDGHAHNHGMLLAVKRLVKRLWQKWRGQEGDILPAIMNQPKRNSVPATRKAKAHASQVVAQPSARTKPTTRVQPKKAGESDGKAKVLEPTKKDEPSQIHRLARIALPQGASKPATAARPVMNQRKTISAAKTR